MPLCVKSDFALPSFWYGEVRLDRRNTKRGGEEKVLMSLRSTDISCKSISALNFCFKFQNIRHTGEIRGQQAVLFHDFSPSAERSLDRLLGKIIFMKIASSLCCVLPTRGKRRHASAGMLAFVQQECLRLEYTRQCCLSFEA